MMQKTNEIKKVKSVEEEVEDVNSTFLSGQTAVKGQV